MTTVPVKKFRTMTLGARTLMHDVDRIVTGYKALEREAAANDGMSESSYDDTIAGHSELNPVEMAAHLNLGDLNGEHPRRGPALKASRMVHLVQEIAALAHELITIADSSERPQTDERPRCIGTGDQAGATCRNWADDARRDGRCIDCRLTVRSEYKRKYMREYMSEYRRSL